MRRICIVLTTRGNFAKMKTTMAAIVDHPGLELLLVVGGALLNRQVAILEEIEQEGYSIDATLDYMMASETPEAIGASAALCLARASDMLSRLRPDVLMVIADRYESLALAQAALCNNIRIAHLEGGEVSGSIDERIRHAITKLAHYHFPASQAAADRIVRLGEHRETVALVGSPSFDLLTDSNAAGTKRLVARLAGTIDLECPFLVVSQHPVVTEYADSRLQFRTVAEAVLALQMPAIWILPNNDAGADAVAEALGWLKRQQDCPAIAQVAALPIEEYGVALQRTRCLVGNSSSAIRESAFLGTPAVNIGTRQRSREQGPNVLDVPCELDAIVAAVRQQLQIGRFPPDTRYGDGTAGQRIAATLAADWPRLDKTITF